jgi:SAM-dependent methyltransferase
MTGPQGLHSFVEWGGPAWERQVEVGIAWLGDVAKLRLLEIGTRHGGMATYFAKRGAEVTALDITDETFEAARALARAHGVADRVDFRTYSGDPEDLPSGYDVVFAKSTLVLMGDADAVGRGIAASLVPGGRLLAIENARGPLAVHLVRAIRRRSWRPYGANYFTPRSLTMLGAHLDVRFVRWTRLPPTVVIGARRTPS